MVNNLIAPLANGDAAAALLYFVFQSVTHFPSDSENH